MQRGKVARSPYLITEPTLISFSGGRSSAYMLHQTLEANGGIPDGSMVAFANTGKEMPQTLDFVKACSDQWGVAITWVELAEVTTDGVYEKGPHKGKPRRRYSTKIVDYDTASRNGEPFMHLIKARGMAPNRVARFCTAELKVRRINDISERCHSHFVGIRADEQRRAAKLHNKIETGRSIWCPMYSDGVTRHDVGNFWARQSFDLGLSNDGGNTLLGNCDLCFLKGKKKKIAIARSRPELVNWWVEAEAVNNGRFVNEYSYAELQAIATDGQGDLFDEPEFACFCGD